MQGLIQAPQMCETKSLRNLGVMEQLNIRKEKATQELDEINKTIEMFSAHPEFEQCLSQLARVGIYR
ncbi:MAG: hypothetical protein PHE17_17935 [Thiothrix sp.]|uniref:hypothetical protein n=1 Tax=Thiothrix sp. TaxID=1032 RepID=UPI0026235D96|nr:hypothetical protein [Thiothrix sp.]MDD5394901.1 hypothetical protein [Thiothrix sp.]